MNDGIIPSDRGSEHSLIVVGCFVDLSIDDSGFFDKLSRNSRFDVGFVDRSRNGDLVDRTGSGSLVDMQFGFGLAGNDSRLGRVDSLRSNNVVTDGGLDAD